MDTPKTKTWTRSPIHTFNDAGGNAIGQIHGPPIEAPPTWTDPAPPEPTPDEQRATAYDQVFSWNGVALHPYSVSRKALNLRLQALDVPLTDEAIEASNAASFGTCARYVWICARPWNKIVYLRERGTKALFADYDEWMDINITPDQESEIMDLGLRIAASGRCARAVPKGESAPGEL